MAFLLVLDSELVILTAEAPSETGESDCITASLVDNKVSKLIGNLQVSKLLCSVTKLLCTVTKLKDAHIQIPGYAL